MYIYVCMGSSGSSGSPEFKTQSHQQTNKNQHIAKHVWLTPVTLATWKAEIGSIVVWGQPREIVHETPISKITRAKWAGGLAQVVEHLLGKPRVQPISPPHLTNNNKKKNLPICIFLRPLSWEITESVCYGLNHAPPHSNMKCEALTFVVTIFGSNEVSVRS
jgi:hypothetical protein